MKAIGRKGSVELDGPRIVIRSQGMFGRNRADQIIPIAQVRTIHYKSPSAMIGYIYFETGAGSVITSPAIEASERRGGMQFTKAAEADFVALRDAIQNYLDSSA